MRVPLAFFSLVALWSLTPLAIKWSGEGPGYLMGVMSRMSLGLVGVLLILVIRRTPVPLDRGAVLTYLAGNLQIYGSMFLTYWASQHIPSGWISVIYGLTPLLTAPLAAFYLKEDSLTAPRLLSYVAGVSGLACLFHSALTFSQEAMWGVLAVVAGAFLQALSSVWVKRIKRELPAFTLVAGILLLAVPLYVLSWWSLDGHIPDPIPMRALASILFLGLVATVFGFALYFYILKNLAAGQVALVTLLTPVLSLYVGHGINQEPLQESTLIGTAFVMVALMLYESRLLLGLFGRLLGMGVRNRNKTRRVGRRQAARAMGGSGRFRSRE